MKRSFLILAFLASFASFGQTLNTEIQIGGTNFIGLSINAEGVWNLNDNNAIGLKLGLGVPVAFFDDKEAISSTLIGLHYYYKDWGIGMEAAGYHAFPFVSPLNTTTSPEMDMMLFPNINYTFHLESSYLKVGAGVWMPMSYYPGAPGSGELNAQIEDPIPGISLSWGISFKR